MRSRSIYTSEAGAKAAAALYDRTLRCLPFTVQERIVETRFGDAHVLVAGPEDAPPLMLWQGTAVPGPFMLLDFEPLVKRYRVYAPDSPGQVGGRSTNASLDPRNHDAGLWCSDVIQGLGLTTFSAPLLHVGFSLGGAFALDLAAVAPQLISAAALLVPAGVHPHYGRRWHTLRTALLVIGPMLLLRYLPCATTERLAFGQLFDEPDAAAVMLDQMRIAFKYAAYFPPPPRRLETADLAGYAAPTLVITGRRDVFGGGEAMATRALAIIPDCEVEVVDCRHVPSRGRMAEVHRRILEFFEGKGIGGKA